MESVNTEFAPLTVKLSLLGLILSFASLPDVSTGTVNLLVFLHTSSTERNVSTLIK